jgi:hypothetical protein
MTEESSRELVREIVRGERHWSHLPLVGVSVRTQGGAVEVQNHVNFVVVPEVMDLAHGFKAYRNRSEDCRIWASILLAGSGFLDLGALEGRPVGDLLLEGLWDAAESGTISPQLTALVNNLVK